MLTSKGGIKADLAQKQKDRIKTIMTSMNCPKNYECYKSGFHNICKAEYHGLGEFASCLEKSGTICEFRVPYGRGVYCSCSLRVYIAKNLGI